MASRIGEDVDAKPILVRRNICRLYDLKYQLNYQIARRFELMTYLFEVEIGLKLVTDLICYPLRKYIHQ